MLRQYYSLLRCPDDGHDLSWRKNKSLECVRCRRTFPIFSDNVVELLPSKPYPVEQLVDEKYLTTYIRLLESKFEWNPFALGWGDLSAAPKGYQAFVRKERGVIEECLGKNLQGLFCDVSGGAGNYSLYFANVASLVVHCDLDVDSINCAYEKSKERSKNILFVRCDHLQLPFAQNTFDSMICTDTIERGYPYEVRLLAEISRCLKPHGRFVVDCHNKLRTSYFPFFKTKSKNGGYNYAELQKIFSRLNLDCYEIKAFGYAPSSCDILPFEKAYTFLDEIFQLLSVPSARWIVAGERK
jgi:SAM-dependent methyltransferase